MSPSKAPGPEAVGCSALLDPSYKLNQCLDLAGDNLTTVTAIIVYVLWQQTAEVSAQSLESPPSDKISAKLGS